MAKKTVAKKPATLLTQFVSQSSDPGAANGNEEDILRINVPEIDLKTEPIQTDLRYDPKEEDPIPIECGTLPFSSVDTVAPQEESVIYCFNDYTSKTNQLSKRNGIDKHTSGIYSDLMNFDSEYPSSTEVCCWNCTYEFKTRPIGLPVKSVGDTMKCIGCFCSFACACRFHIDTNRGDGVLLKQLYSRCNVMDFKLPPSFDPAPPKELLERFGGKMTIDQYRQNSHDFTVFEGIQVVYPITRQMNPMTITEKKPGSKIDLFIKKINTNAT